MSFTAGMAALGRNDLGAAEQKAFARAIEHLGESLPSRPETMSLPKLVLAGSGADRLWQGPKKLATKDCAAVAAGVQWRPIEGRDSALEVLCEEFFKPEPRPPGVFDCFSGALFNKRDHTLVLTTDPLGLSPVYYHIRNGTLVFSSHQLFIRAFLGQDIRPDFPSVLEYLIIGHQIGNRSLLKGVQTLPPGVFLTCANGATALNRYQVDVGRGSSCTGLSPSQAAGVLSDYLVSKRENYERLSNTPIAGFLSGGWDSRYLLALFADAGRVARTFTTQQRLRRRDFYISEEAIAGDVAAHLRLPNQFVPPTYRDASNMLQRAEVLDFSTWFHDWAFHMADTVPKGQYLLADGLLGDLLLRGLFLDDSLADLMTHGERGGALDVLHGLLVGGFNTYTRGAGSWERILVKSVIKKFEEALREDVRQELRDIEHDDFISLFLLRNRSRRGIAPLSRLVFGRVGDVHLPFCDPGFVHLALTLPLAARRDGSVYRELLERARPGLSSIPSTNERDLGRLRPYLVKGLPPETLAGRSARKAGKIEAIMTGPPETFMPILRPEIRRAFQERDAATIGRHLLFLEKIYLLEGFFRPKKLST